MRPFRQVDVFPALDADASESGFRGNALAVVHDADGLTDEQMAAFARWTNLSETVFLLLPTDPAADYRVRIWTTGGELPFAGHPTLGSAHAWLDAGGLPQDAGIVVQECGAGLVSVRRGDVLAFAAPPLGRSGPVDADLRFRVGRALAIDPGRVLEMAWIDNGPGWIGVEVDSAATVLAIEPSIPDFTDLKVAVIGRYAVAPGRGKGAATASPEGRQSQPLVEVRAFYADGRDFGEDPVTGSANAGLAQWLVGSGRLPTAYIASQGTRLQRKGRVHVEAIGDDLWIGGATVTRIVGEVDL
jgi:PhzF family phenazine biosynthesis protein